MKTIGTITVGIFFWTTGFAQKDNAEIHKGNEFYKKKNFEASLQEYNQALITNPKNTSANYNMGNAQFRINKLDEALLSYDNTIGENETEKPLREKAYYNKGVALSKQQRLEESIDAWKASLKLDPNDNDARENLQKALMELKRQQEQNNQNKEKNKEKEKQKQPEQKPQQQLSKLTKQQVEQLLKALQQKEREVQQKLQKGSPTLNKPEKDW